MLTRHPAGILTGKKNIFTQRNWAETIELVEHCEKHGKDKDHYWHGRPLDSNRRGESSFFGVDSYAETVDLVKNGWVSKTGELKSLGEEALALPALREFYEEVRGYDVAGYEMDIPRYLTGDPEYFVSEGEDVAGTKKIINLVVNISAASFWTVEQLFHRGAALFAIVDALERAGRDVELIAANYLQADRSGGYARQRFVVKRAGEQFDMSRAAFALGHPAMLRQVVFADCCRAEMEDYFTTGLGSVLPPYTRPTEKELEAEPETCFIMSADGDVRDACSTLEGAVGVVKDTLLKELKRIGELN